MSSAPSSPDDTLAFAPPPVVASGMGEASLPSGYLGLGIIGRSEVSVVHRAYDLSTGATVAVSVPTDPLHADREVIARVARVTHPAAIRVLGEARCGTGTCCVMEFVEGRPVSEVLPLLRDRVLHALTLDDLVAVCCIDRRRLHPEIASLARGRGVWHRLAVRWMIDVCGVVRESHGLGLSNLSPRPSRLLLRSDGRVAVTGLGLASIDPDPASRGADVRDLVACLKELLTLRADPSVAAARAMPAELSVACDECLTRTDADRALTDLSDAMERWLARPFATGVVGLMRRFWPAAGTT